MNRMRPATLQEQLQTLVGQYRTEMAQVEAHGGAQAPEAQRHLENANRIREILTRFSQQRAAAQQNAQQQQPQQQQQAPQQQPQQQPGYDQQQIYNHQVQAAAGQQGAMANMRVMQGFQNQQQQLDELRRVGERLEQQLQAATAALRTVDTQETRQRLMRSIQGLRQRRDQVRSREQQAMAAVAQSRQNIREPGAQQGPPRGAQQGAQGGPQQGQQGPHGHPAHPQGPGGPGGPPHPQAQAMQGHPQAHPLGPPGAAPGAAPGHPSANGQHPQAAQRNGAPSAQAPSGQPPSGPSAPTTPHIRSTQSMPIPQQLNVAPPTPVTMRAERPTLLSGGSVGASALNSPALARIPQFEVGSDRVLSKRRLSELVAGILGEETESLFDGDVEELLLDLADEFVTSVTTFACRLAKHRKSDTLEVKDVQMHLERNWNLRIPGFSADDVRSIRKVAPTAAYQQKVQGVNLSKSVNK